MQCREKKGADTMSSYASSSTNMTKIGTSKAAAREGATRRTLKAVQNMQTTAMLPNCT